MDKVTQQSAANAEESASASQEMNSQAVSMQDIVRGLTMLVGGKNGRWNGASKNERADMKKMLKENKEKPRSLSLPLSRLNKVEPHQIISMNDGEFTDF